MIYHITTEADFRAQLAGHAYRPPNLAVDGFVHCALEDSVIAVANDFYAQAAVPVLLLEIDPARLTAETRYEAPAPIAVGGTSHLAGAALFPHVYGPIDREAIVGVGVLSKDADGYRWPARFVPLSEYHKSGSHFC